VRRDGRGSGIGAWAPCHQPPAGLEPGPQAVHYDDLPGFAFPFVACVCVVDIDKGTGETKIRRFYALDDCGTRIDPMHPIGAKGVAESPYVARIPTFSNAMVDAIAHPGVTHFDMPYSAWRVWQQLKRSGITG